MQWAFFWHVRQIQSPTRPDKKYRTAHTGDEKTSGIGKFVLGYLEHSLPVIIVLGAMKRFFVALKIKRWQDTHARIAPAFAIHDQDNIRHAGKHQQQRNGQVRPPNVTGQPHA